MSDNFWKLNVLKDFELPKEETINFHKNYSDVLSESKEKIKPNKCLICDQINKKFCNSHSIPRECLEQIAKNGKVRNFNGIIEVPALDEENGLNSTGTFRLICRDCDNLVFKQYETFENYKSRDFITDEILNQIALKNYLKFLSKKKIEKESIPAFTKKMNIPVMFKDFDITEKWDVRDAQINFKKTKGLLNNKSIRNYYRLIMYEELYYTVPLAFQCHVNLVTDFDGNLINNLYDFSKNNSLQDIHICVFPYKGKSFIIVFTKSIYTKYSRFVKKFNKLSLEDRLGVINYIIFLYSEDYYYSPYLPEDVMSKVFNVARVTPIPTKNLSENDILQNSIKMHDLNKWNTIPNLLGKEYSMEELFTI